MDGNGSAARSGTTGLTPNAPPCVVGSVLSKVYLLSNEALEDIEAGVARSMALLSGQR